MSTTLGIIKGRQEIPQKGIMKSNYKDSELVLTRFSGGTKNGTMLQISTENDHIQLTVQQVRNLIDTLEKL